MTSLRSSNRRRARALLLACAMVLALSTPVAARPRGTVTIAVDDGAITLEAVDAAWPDVIRELTRTTGIVLHVTSLPEQPITASFRRVDPAQVLRRLFGAGAGFAFVYGAGPLPSEVWVTSMAAPSARATTRPVTMPAPAEPGHADAEMRANEADRLASEEGAGAIEALARVVVTDPDAGVRSAAATGLVRIGTPHALDAARSAIFDEAKVVRLRTVEALADKGGEPAYGILREAMRDDEEEVRDAAAAGMPDAEVTNAAHRSALGR